MRQDLCFFEGEEGYCAFDGICKHKDRNWLCQATDDDLMTEKDYLQSIQI